MNDECKDDLDDLQEIPALLVVQELQVIHSSPVFPAHPRNRRNSKMETGAGEGGNWTCRSSSKMLLQSNTHPAIPTRKFNGGECRIHGVWSGVKVSHGLVASYVSTK